jgi:crossover junction endodeoxyribonuclease RuvC
VTATTIRILGIDPGLSGALALLTSLGELTVDDMPTVEIERGGKSKRELDTAALCSLIREMAPSHAVLERVGARPGQGVTSMFAFGRSCGQIEGAIAARRVPLSYVAPPTWRRALSVPVGKDGSRLRASQVLPAHAERWRRVKDDGRAEAALIALWGLLHVPRLEIAQ